MLTGIHFLLTYRCLFECDHCFLFCGPNAEGTFTLDQVRRTLDETVKIGTVRTVYFEGGESFLYYPLLIESVREARHRGFEVGIVTNGYFATTVEDAEIWLAPLCKLGLADLSVSDDAFHSQEENSPAKRALEAARGLGLPVDSICIDKPNVNPEAHGGEKGAPVVGGGVMFRGRAAEKLTADLPERPWSAFGECPHEELADPARVHVDPFGNVHLCQGLSMGNMWETPLSTLAARYRARNHPIAGPLLEGGPALLASRYGIPHAEGYVDACHFCYRMRQALVDRFPRELAPRQVYGLSMKGAE